jgi:hypothetical protein
MRRLSDIGSKDLRYRWMGHPEGRDILLFTLGSVFFKGNLSYSADVSFIRRGENVLFWNWGAGPGFYDQRTPTGTAENRLSAALQANWKPLSCLTLKAYLSGSMIFNQKHIEKKQAYGLETAFSVIFTY